MGKKTQLYAPRLYGDIDLGYEPSQIDTDGNRKLAKMVFPGTLLPGQTAAEIYTSGTDKKYPIGTRLQIDERVFRYAYVSGNACIGGRAAANVSTNEESAVAGEDSAVGDTTVTIVVVAAGGLTANELAGGYLCYKSTRYYQHRILSHPQADNGNDCILTLETALVGHGVTDGATTLCAYHSPWAKVGYGDVGVYFSAIGFVGWPFGNIATGQYTWLQTWGPVNVCPTEFYGGIANQRQCWFAADGSIVTFKTGANPFSYQHAGFWIPCTYYGSLHAMSDGGHLMFLQICP